MHRKVLDNILWNIWNNSGLVLTFFQDYFFEELVIVNPNLVLKKYFFFNSTILSMKNIFFEFKTVMNSPKKKIDNRKVLDNIPWKILYVKSKNDTME